MYLAFDTETTDLPRPHLDMAHASQPHLIQFAGVIFNDDGQELDRLCTLVRPGPNAGLSPQAFQAHGIPLELAASDGMDPMDVFLWFTGQAKRAKQIIGHNIHFDIQIMAILGLRLTGEIWFPPSRLYCTMVNATPIVNIPPTPRMIAAGRYHAKSPTLAECIDHFFGEKLMNAHDAAADVSACIRLFRHLNREEGLAA